MSKKSLIVYIVVWSLVGDSLRRRHNLTSVSNVCEAREGGRGFSLQEAYGDVPLDGVAFSRLD